MQDWMLVKQAQISQNERLRQAHLNHLAIQAEQVLRDQNPTLPVYAPALARIGGWLVAWGNRLQTEYGNIAACLDEAQPTRKDGKFVSAKP
jgi:hypothetical protein